MNLNSDQETKICFSSTGQDMDSEIDSRFGRCSFFVLVKVKNGKILETSSIPNSAASQGGGAGVSASEQIADLGAEVLITGNIGPKADQVLNRLEIKVIKESGKIKEVLNKYL